MIAIIDYGLGNLSSIHNMCKRLGIDSMISRDENELKSADKFILPGVGHFKRGMENLKDTGLYDLLNDLVIDKKKPILGICLGAQLMTQHSEEGDVEGLGWIDATTVKFDSSKMNGHKVPHMGWTAISTIENNILWQNLPADPRFYFVHTYHFLFNNQQEISATADYAYSFACAFNKGNIYGTQFHPEKSHKYGMKVIENFNNVNAE